MTNQNFYETSFVANREVRRIPAGWQHPKDARGRYLPLHAAGYLLAMPAHERDEIAESYQILPAYAGRSFLMPAVECTAEIAAYETTTEGTPCSPAFPDDDAGRLALVNWCGGHVATWGDHNADAETWAAILFGGTMAAVSTDGSVSFG